MKKLIGKVIYFILNGTMEFVDFLDRHHFISDKASLNFGSSIIDKMEYTVINLIGVTEYKNFTIKFNE